MKQHITGEQLNELSNKGKKKLMEWWKPERGDIYIIKNPEDADYLWGGRNDDDIYVASHTMEQEDHSIWVWDEVSTTEEYGCGSDVNKTLPLLSIGQMIEFLESKNFFNTLVMTIEPSNGQTKTLFWKEKIGICDSLWEDIKEVLKDG